MRPRRFPRRILAELHEAQFIRIRAGNEHRFIGIWVVVVKDRVFVRSWSMKPRSWWRSFLEEPRGAIQLGGREIAVRAAQARSEPIRDAVDQAYVEKYNTQASLKWARGLGSAKRRETTTELRPR